MAHIINYIYYSQSFLYDAIINGLILCFFKKTYNSDYKFSYSNPSLIKPKTQIVFHIILLAESIPKYFQKADVIRQDNRRTYTQHNILINSKSD